MPRKNIAAPIVEEGLALAFAVIGLARFHLAGFDLAVAWGVDRPPFLVRSGNRLAFALALI